MKRIRPGIPGFDKMIGGGIPEGYSLVVKGVPGSGKTIFSIQYLIEGLKNNEVCFYISLEETKKKLEMLSKSFNWNIQKYLDDNLFIEYLHMKDPGEIYAGIKDMITSFDTKRLVIDNYSYIKCAHPDIRSYTSDLSAELESAGVTSLLITEHLNPAIEKMRFNCIDFICDGVIVLDFKMCNGIGKHYIYVEKMRSCAVDKTLRPIVFTEDGMRIETSASLTDA